MADVLTTVLGLVKQTIGGNRNTWGNILNNNLDLVEGAFAGMTSLAVSGGSATLTDAERRKRIINITGTLSSNQEVVVENLVGVWLVRNGTTGSYTASFKTSSGTAVAVRQGGWSTVWCDGNDVVRVGPSSYFFETQMHGPDGTISLPGFSFASETGLGIRRAGYASGTLTNPFSTTNTSTTVTVAHTSHGLAVNDKVWLTTATAVGGLTISGFFSVASVPNANSYTFVNSSAATSTAGPGGGTVTYEYMKAAATSGGAIAITKGGADIAHISPYGVIVTGSVRTSGKTGVTGTLDVTGATTLAALLTAATAVFSDVVQFTSTSHMLFPKGTTAQRPSSQTAARVRYNTTTAQPEFDDGSSWKNFSGGALVGSQMPYGAILNGTLEESHAANAVTFSLKTLAGADPSATDPVLVAFRSSSLSTGNYVYRSIEAATSITVPSTATLGVSNSVAFKVWVVLYDDAGTIRMGVINCLGGTSTTIFPLGQVPRDTSIQVGAGSDSAGVFYTSGAACSNKAYAILGYASYESGLAAAGTWGTTPTRLQLFGPGVPLPGATIQEIIDQDGTRDTTAVDMFVDNTIPQITEGAEFINTPITLVSAANLIDVEVQGIFANSDASTCIMALFRDADANALATAAAALTTDWLVGLRIHHKLIANAASATFRMRAGVPTGTLIFNGITGLSLFGGTMNSYIKLTEKSV